MTANETRWLLELKDKTPDGRALYVGGDRIEITTDRRKAKLFDSSVDARLTMLFYLRPIDPPLRVVKYWDGYRIKRVGEKAWYIKQHWTITDDPFKALHSDCKDGAETLELLARRSNQPIPAVVCREHVLTEGWR